MIDRIQSCARRIQDLQDADGAISWVDGGIWDAWNHGESTMGLAIAGSDNAAFRALDCLIDRQDEDGGFTGDLGASVPMDDTNRHLVASAPDQARDTNFTGYVAVTTLRSLLALKAFDRLPRYWAMIERALTFVLAHQTRHGDIVWRARETGEALDDIDSLRAGNASLYKALECAIIMGEQMGRPTAHWQIARRRIGATLRENDARFDRFGTDRRRYAMDWYYPVLTGVLTPDAGKARLFARWNSFVEAGLGCRCVSDEPWVTAAETAELALACLAAGKPAQARTLIEDISSLAADDGGFWMGWQFAEGVIWPQERPSWTAGALIMAMDALDQLSPGSTLLVENSLPECASVHTAAELPASRYD